MKIQPVCAAPLISGPQGVPDQKSPSFGYSNQLKTLFKEGKLPSVLYDVSGRKLTLDNVTLDHVIPKSKGGLNKIENYMLATAEFNHLRGARPLSDFLTPENLAKYFKQFVGVQVENFNGNKYIKSILETLEKANKLGL